jgi:GNAT superfamily N-acetyltransferase
VFALAGELALTVVPARDAFDAAFPALLAEPDTDLLVAEVDGATVGYLLGSTRLGLIGNGPASWVAEVVVQAAHRRRGVGEALLAEFERRALRRGSRLVALATTRAHAFYAALGYADHASYFRKLLPADPVRSER